MNNLLANIPDWVEDFLKQPTMNWYIFVVIVIVFLLFWILLLKKNQLKISTLLEKEDGSFFNLKGEIRHSDKAKMYNTKKDIEKVDKFIEKKILYKIFLSDIKNSRKLTWKGDDFFFIKKNNFFIFYKKQDWKKLDINILFLVLDKEEYAYFNSQKREDKVEIFKTYNDLEKK